MLSEDPWSKPEWVPPTMSAHPPDCWHLYLEPLGLEIHTAAQDSVLRSRKGPGTLPPLPVGSGNPSERDGPNPGLRDIQGHVRTKVFRPIPGSGRTRGPGGQREAERTAQPRQRGQSSSQGCPPSSPRGPNGSLSRLGPPPPFLEIQAFDDRCSASNTPGTRCCTGSTASG